MASVYRRKKKDGTIDPIWVGQYKTAGGKWRTFKGSRDKRHTLQKAQELEARETELRLGVANPVERAVAAQAFRPCSEHLKDYRLELLARGDTVKHIDHTIGAIQRLLDDSAAVMLSEIQANRVTAALGRLRVKRSARTSNHARTALLGWVKWLWHNARILAPPPGLMGIRPANLAVDRKRIRRALSPAEAGRLYVATAGSDETIGGLDGIDRSVLYRLAFETGLRANELRTLTPESFQLDGPDPVVVVKAGHSKHRREDRQPLPAAAPAWLRPWLETRTPGKTMFGTMGRPAKMLRADLARIEVPYQTDEGVIDFHALRGSAVTHWVDSGIEPSVAQKLARHSTITLTMDRYKRTTPTQIRDALDSANQPEDKPPGPV
jgi:integrase